MSYYFEHGGIRTIQAEGQFLTLLGPLPRRSDHLPLQPKHSSCSGLLLNKVVLKNSSIYSSWLSSGQASSQLCTVVSSPLSVLLPATAFPQL